MTLSSFKIVSSYSIIELEWTDSAKTEYMIRESSKMSIVKCQKANVDKKRRRHVFSF
jgi:hypothetical protein